MATADERLMKLSTHLDDVLRDSQLPLDEKLFEECELLLVPYLLNSHDRLIHVVIKLAKLLNVAPKPEPAVRLLAKLVPALSWSEIASFDPPVDFASGLSVGALPFNHLALDLIGKASSQPKDVALLAGMPNIVESIITLSLLSPDTGVAHKAADTIISLLTADLEAGDVARHGVGDGPVRQHGQGQGLMWRRFFEDQNIFNLFFVIPSLKDRSKGTKREKTIAQGRLLDLVSRMSLLDWNYLTRSHQPSIEKAYNLSSDEGLLDFAFIHVVEYKEDVLLHMTLIQACTELLRISTGPPSSRASDALSTCFNVSSSAYRLPEKRALQYLKSKALHQHAISCWSFPEGEGVDPLDVSFLYGCSAEYYCVYLSLFPDDFLQESAQVRHVLEKLSKAFDISAQKWTRSGQVPKHDIAVLSSLPPIAMLPQTYLGSTLKSSPLLMVPCAATNSDALNSLAHVFQSSRDTLITDGSLSDMEVESISSAYKDHRSSGARAAFISYFRHHQTLFTDLTTHADTVALPENALPAINVLSTILSADWMGLPDENQFDENAAPTSTASLPSEDKLSSLLPRAPGFPDKFGLKGIDVLLNLPPQQDIIPWILTPPKKFSNLIGGTGDAESAAFKVASAKWDFVQLFYSLVRQKNENSPNSRLEDLQLVLNNRIRDGMWGRDPEIGGRIATIGS